MISIAVLTKKGSREMKEDSLAYKQQGEEALLALADGLGGHSKGEIASQTAVAEALCCFTPNGEERADVVQAFQKAQNAIMQKQNQMHEIDGMKTTMVLCRISQSKIVWAHIGDSRLYLFEKGKMITRTLDHSVPQLLVFAGDIKEKQIRFHPDRSRLLKVMGIPWEKPDYEVGEIRARKPGQAILMCSDGFWEWIDEKKMIHCLKKAKDVEQWLELMRQEVEKNGRGKEMDNYTAICAWVN